MLTSANAVPRAILHNRPADGRQSLGAATGAVSLLLLAWVVFMTEVHMPGRSAIGNDRPIQPRFPRWSGPAAGMGLVALVVGGLLAWPGGHTVAADQISTSVAQETRFSSLVVFSAEVGGEQGGALTASEGGTVNAILKRNGDSVAAGDVVALLSNPELRRSVAETLFRIEEQEAALAAQVADAERRTSEAARAVREAHYRAQVQSADLARYEVLETRGFASAARMLRLREDAAFSADEAKAALEGLQAARRRELAITSEANRSRGQLRERAATEQDRLKTLELRAPQDGVVSGLTTTAGTALTPGQTVARISSGASNQIEADVLDDQALLLGVGGFAHLLDDPAFQLRIVAIDPEVNKGQVSVRLEFTGVRPARLRAGQTLQVAFETGSARRAIVVPQGDAISPDGLWVVDRSGRRAERRRIVLGERAAGRVEIRSGVSAGERVLISSRKDLTGLDEIVIAR